MAEVENGAQETCLKDGCDDLRMFGSCMCRPHTMAGANPLGPDDEWTCDCGGWDDEYSHNDEQPV